MEKSVVLERVYVVPLKRAWNSAYHKRTRKAVRMLKEFASRHMKSEVVLVDKDLNNYIWRRGNANPPRKIKVKMIKYDTGEVLIKKYEEGKGVEKIKKESDDKKINEKKDVNSKTEMKKIKKEEEVKSKTEEKEKNEDKVNNKEVKKKSKSKVKKDASKSSKK